MIACTFSKHAMFILSGLLLTSTELNDIQSTFVILKSKDSLIYFETSVPRHIRFAELRKK